MTTNQLNLDKYEGHTPAPWPICHWLTTTNEKDVELITDALLILQALIDERAEVQRLREGIQDICNTGTDTNAEWVSMTLTRLKELIE